MKTIMAIVGGVLIGLYVVDIHVFGLVGDKQAFIGLALGLLSLCIHVLNGGNILPGRKKS